MYEIASLRSLFRIPMGLISPFLLSCGLLCILAFNGAGVHRTQLKLWIALLLDFSGSAKKSLLSGQSAKTRHACFPAPKININAALRLFGYQARLPSSRIPKLALLRLRVLLPEQEMKTLGVPMNS